MSDNTLATALPIEGSKPVETDTKVYYSLY